MLLGPQVVWQGGVEPVFQGRKPVCGHCTVNATVRNVLLREVHRVVRYCARRGYIVMIGTEYGAGQMQNLHIHIVIVLPDGYYGNGRVSTQCGNFTKQIKTALQWETATGAHPLHTWSTNEQDDDAIWYCAGIAVRTMAVETDAYWKNVEVYPHKAHGQPDHLFWALNVDRVPYEERVAQARLAGNADFDFQGMYITRQNLYKTMWRWCARFRSEHVCLRKLSGHAAA